MSLVLQATLLGKATTNSESGHLLVTLRIGRQNLELTLSPDQATMFPDLVSTQPHPTERRRQHIQYNSAPAYTVTIDQVIPEPAALGSSELTTAMVNAKIAVAEHANQKPADPLLPAKENEPEPLLPEAHIARAESDRRHVEFQNAQK
jgi:hypothetical protein